MRKTAKCFAPIATAGKATYNRVSFTIFHYRLLDLSDKQAANRHKKTAKILCFPGLLPFHIFFFSYTITLSMRTPLRIRPLTQCKILLHICLFFLSVQTNFVIYVFTPCEIQLRICSLSPCKFRYILEHLRHYLQEAVFVYTLRPLVIIRADRTVQD